MIEFLSIFARWSQLTANLILLGSCVFLAIAGHHQTLHKTSWSTRLENGFVWLTGIILVGLIGVLATTTGEATGVASNTWDPDAWLKMIEQTRVGHIWVARFVLAIILLGIILAIRRYPRTRLHYILYAIAASLPLIAGTLTSHSGAEDISFVSIAPYALHMLMAGIWFGALPAFLLIVFDKSDSSDKAAYCLNVNYLKKFSAIALPVMLLLAITGLIVTDRMVDTQYHTLVSSPYGWLLNLKLVLLAIILSIAYQARYHWLPLLSQAQDIRQVKDSIIHLQKWIRIEFILALLLILFATILANTLPAKHTMVENWPFPFRFSINATWDEPNVQEMFWSGATLLIIAIVTLWIGIRINWNRQKRILVPSLLTIAALAIALPPLAIEAYPETYKKPTVAFDTISIANGSRLFAEHCADCHGPQGKGNGERAGALSSEPTDLLTEPHTARHTVGNFYHWLSQGIPGTDMPGFSANLSEEDRWDLVNFLHALSRGFDARLLGSMIVPEYPAIGAPVFFYSTRDSSSNNLKDFRLDKNVLLVLFSWPQSQKRLAQLKDAYEEIGITRNTQVLAVPMHDLTDSELLEITNNVPFPVVTEGWSEIKDSYWLYRRVRTVPDLMGKGMVPGHMEFLVDRFGYLRARWVTQFEGFGWQNISALTLQLDQLNQENEIMPPPGDHAH